MTAYRIATDEREPCYINRLDEYDPHYAYGWCGTPEFALTFQGRAAAERAAQFIGNRMHTNGYGEAAALLRIVPKRGGAATGWRYKQGATT